MAIGKKCAVSAERCLGFLWLYVFVAALASALLNLLPFYGQQIEPALALILPAALLSAMRFGPLALERKKLSADNKP